MELLIILLPLAVIWWAIASGKRQHGRDKKEVD